MDFEGVAGSTASSPWGSTFPHGEVRCENAVSPDLRTPRMAWHKHSDPRAPRDLSYGARAAARCGACVALASLWRAVVYFPTPGLFEAYINIVMVGSPGWGLPHAREDGAATPGEGPGEHRLLRAVYQMMLVAVWRSPGAAAGVCRCHCTGARGPATPLPVCVGAIVRGQGGPQHLQELQIAARGVQTIPCLCGVFDFLFLPCTAISGSPHMVRPLGGALAASSSTSKSSSARDQNLC
jgi:hypothetical protein